MQTLTLYGQQLVQNIAQRYGLGTDAVFTLLQALISGNGSMAQFYHPELGGNGQWMQGGMIMLGDMFNNNLKACVDGVCQELSQAVMGTTPLFVVPAPSMISGVNHAGWPPEWGQPSATGSQNDTRYAIFPASRRLALEQGGQMTVYDTLDHQITGISQQQGGGLESWVFNSQYGNVRLTSLPIIGSAQPEQPIYPMSPDPADSCYSPDTNQAPLAVIEKLGELLQKGLITPEEFGQKKAELLKRI